MLELTHDYASLPEAFHAANRPALVRNPTLFAFNEPLAEALGLPTSDQSRETLAALFSGNRLPPTARPVAMAYAGHQFGQFVPRLGDGRATLLGELKGRDGQLYDVHLKGAGATPFSRGGDGRSALGPVIREYLLSEAMHALGVRTTRALAAVTTGETVVRDALRPGAILTRVARSHVRVGTFQYFAARGDRESLATLAHYVIDRHYPEAAAADNPIDALLRAVIRAQAALVASWLQLGFVHGVMNTDNCSIAGETIDYGPCAFMEAYDPQAVWSSIDRFGRYAYGNQAPIAHWNLARLAETLLPLLNADEEAAVELANAALEEFGPTFERAWLAGFGAKLGLPEPRADDASLIEELLTAMHADGADFTVTFRHLADVVAPESGAMALGRALQSGRQIDAAASPERPEALAAWLPAWRARLAADERPRVATVAALRAANPALIPRNHRVEEAIRAAEDQGDFAPFERLRRAWQQPFTVSPGDEDLTHPAAAEEQVTQTFCGT